MIPQNLKCPYCSEPLKLLDVPEYGGRLYGCTCDGFTGKRSPGSTADTGQTPARPESLTTTDILNEVLRRHRKALSKHHGATLELENLAMWIEERVQEAGDASGGVKGTRCAEEESLDRALTVTGD